MMSKAAYRTVVIGFILLVGVVFGIMYWGFNNIHDNISKFKDDFKEKESISNSIRYDNGPLIIDYSDVDSLGNVTLKEKELENLNKHISHLAIELEDEYVKVQELIDSDIERIGIMMTITIGILTLLLGVLPFISNLITRQDMREEVNKLSSKIDSAESAADKAGKLIKVANDAAATASEAAEMAKTKAEEAEKKVTEQSKQVTELTAKTEKLNESVDKRLPMVSVMAVHVAISRLVNVSNHVQNGAGPGKPIYLMKTVEAILSSIQKCREENIEPANDRFFRSALVDLIFALENWPFATAIYGRQVQELRQVWRQDLIALTQSNSDNFKDNYVKIEKTMSEIVEELGSLNG